jgi:hypothetical protein
MQDQSTALAAVATVTDENDASGSASYQGLAYYYSFWKARAQTAFCRSTCCPALMIEFAGAEMCIYAVAVSGRVHCQPLTQGFRLYCQQSTDMHMMTELARVMRALRVCLTELGQFYAAPVMAVGHNPDKSRSLPYLLEYDAQVVHASVVQLLHKQLYVAPLVGGGSVMVKYTQRYGADVHRAWASGGLAPRLLSCQRMPGGWLEVRMEVMEPEDGWVMLSSCPAREELRGVVLEHMQRAHNIDVSGRRGVHGDLRDCNVVVNVRDRANVGVRFVDFDWAGVEGEVSYPPYMNPDISWAKGVACGQLMLQQHDADLLSLPGEEQVDHF